VVGAAADSFGSQPDINPFMDEFCEGANRAAQVVIAFLLFVTTFHLLAISAAVVIWLYEKLFGRRD